MKMIMINESSFNVPSSLEALEFRRHLAHGHLRKIEAELANGDP
jgi:hypothetical protein